MREVAKVQGGYAAVRAIRNAERGVRSEYQKFGCFSRDIQPRLIFFS